jgi:hypothetical protein
VTATETRDPTRAGGGDGACRTTPTHALSSQNPLGRSRPSHPRRPLVLRATGAIPAPGSCRPRSRRAGRPGMPQDERKRLEARVDLDLACRRRGRSRDRQAQAADQLPPAGSLPAAHGWSSTTPSWSPTPRHPRAADRWYWTRPPWSRSRRTGPVRPRRGGSSAAATGSPDLSSPCPTGRRSIRSGSPPGPAAHPRRRAAQDPAPRCPPQLRHRRAGGRRPAQGDQPAPRTRHDRDHDGHLQPRHSGTGRAGRRDGRLILGDGVVIADLSANNPLATGPDFD